MNSTLVAHFRALGRVVAAALALCLLSCGDQPTTPTGEATKAKPAASAAAPPPAPAAPAVPPILQQPIQPLDEAVLRAANNLFATALVAAPPEKHALVIDPLVDGLTGVQSNATLSMEQKITNLARAAYPKFDVQPFTTAAISKAPVLLIGTFTTINAKAQTSGQREAFRICLALADLRTGKVVAKGIARAQLANVDLTPLPYYTDSPIVAPDKVTEGYVKSCQGTKVGDSLDPAYLDNIVASAVINDAIRAYDAKRYKDALDIYRGVLGTGAGDQLRVYNGIYLTSLKLGKRDDATEAFGKIVDFGLANKRLSVKFLFAPGSTQFVTDPQVSGQYALWLRTIATRTVKSSACLEIVGHTSASGSDPINERISLQRAQYVKQRLDADAAALKTRTKALGKGSQENLIGIGSDDGKDALDRRVEFKVVDCG
jgi:outer membrane protein OmpA-like peptidoglycan-associated protein